MLPLSEVFAHYGHPDPAIVSVLNKNGVDLSYVGHAEITKALSEIDPEWTWEPVLGADGLPAIRIQHGEIPRRDKEPLLVNMATMWGRLTMHGVTRWAVGSVEAHKPDLDKELVSDFLRNAAMRFGVAVGLWMKDTGSATSNGAWTSKPATVTRPYSEGSTATVTQPTGLASDKQVGYAASLYKKAGKPAPKAWLATLNKQEISGVIDRLQGGEFPQAPVSDEEPF